MRSLFTKSNRSATHKGLRAFSAQMQPLRPFYAIGDVHGCMAQMQEALEKVDIDIETQGIENPAVVFLGDYVDRGPNSAQVLEFLFNLKLSEGDDVVCLKGNHETMMVDFIDDPINRGNRWIKYGGLRTLASYDIEGIGEEPDKEQLYAAAEELADAMPDGMLEWLRHLPKHWASGNMHCVHAAMEPDVPIELQSEKTLLWGSEAFEKHDRTDGNWVIHGHTVVDSAHWERGRVALDTGCYFTGVLTVAAFTGVTCRIL